MGTKKSIDRWMWAALAIMVMAVVLRAYFWWQTQYTGEDALITLRYVRNLIQGEGFVYNPGEPVLGTTTPLWTLLLAGLGLLGLEPIATAKVLGIAADAVTVWLLFLIMRREGRPGVGLLAGAILTLSSQNIVVTISSMETALVTLLGVASFYFFLVEKPKLGAGLASLLVLARIDGLVLVAVLALWQLLRLIRGQLQLKTAVAAGAIFVAIQLPWLAFATWYFGSPLPNTMFAKALASTTFNVIQNIYWRLAPGLAGHLMLLAFVTGSIAAWASHRRLLPLAFWFFAYYTLLIAARVAFFPWYILPPSPAFFLLASLGVLTLVDWATAPSKLPLLRGLLLGGLLTTLLGFSAYHLSRSMVANTENQELENGVRKSIGLWVRDNTPPQATVALEPLGYVGYYSERRMYDFVGLVTPIMMEIYRSGAGRPYAVAVRHWQPDYVVLRQSEREEQFNPTTEEGRWFEEHYHLVREFTYSCPDCFAWREATYLLFEVRPG